jgi:hypothetical protein
MILLNFPQGSQEWLESRAGVTTASRFQDATSRIGGLTDQQATFVEALQSGHSEEQALLMAGYKKRPSAANVERALSGQRVDTPSRSAMAYAWTVAMERICGLPLDDTYVTYAMNRGRDLEPQAREAYELRTGYLVEESGLLLTDDRLFGYSTDGVVDDDGMVEIKCPASCDKLGNVWDHPETAHEEYIDQINGGLWLTNRQWCDLVVYCPWLKPVGKDLFIKRIYRDDDAITSLADNLMEFEKMVRRFLAILRDQEKAKRYTHPSHQIPGALAPEAIAPWEGVKATDDAPERRIATEIPELTF